MYLSYLQKKKDQQQINKQTILVPIGSKNPKTNLEVVVGSGEQLIFCSKSWVRLQGPVIQANGRLTF